MVTSVQADSSVLEDSNNVTHHPCISNSDEHQDFKFRLSQSLQTTLELSALMDIFLKQVQNVVPLGGLKYQLPSHNLLIEKGSKHLHHCDYRLISNENNLGEISFCRQKRFNEYELAQLESTLSLLVHPLKNAIQYQSAVIKAYTDSLTEIGNRSALTKALNRELQTALRYKLQLSLLLIDIDHFKAINDNYGHRRGDIVLREVASRINKSHRGTDSSFRYGGEEFVVLLPSTNSQGAHMAAERIRHMISKDRIPLGKKTIRVTASIGAASLQLAKGSDQLFQAADQAMYRAKEGGRNQVVSVEI